jgi:hypothetical protein
LAIAVRVWRAANVAPLFSVDDGVGAEVDLSLI